MFQASRKAKMVPIANRYEYSLGTIILGECGGFLGGNWREEKEEERWSVRLESSGKRNAPRSQVELDFENEELASCK